MNIKLLVSIGNALLIGFLVSITVIGTNKVDTIDSKMTLINDKNSLKQRYAINFRGSVHDRAISIRDVVLSLDSTGVDKAIAEIKQLETFYSDSAAPLDQLMQDQPKDEELRILKEIQAVESRTLPLVKEIIQLVQNGNNADAKRLLLEQASPAFSEWLATINAFIDFQEVQNKNETMTVREISSQFSTLMLTITGLSVIVGVIITFFIINRLMTSLGGEPHFIASLLEKMSTGDLSVEIPRAKKGSVLTSLCHLQMKLTETVEGINEAARNIDNHKSMGQNDSSVLMDISTKQSRSSEQANAAFQSVRNEADQIAELLTFTLDNSKASLNSSAEGVAAVDRACAEIKTVHQTMSRAVENIKQLEKRTQEISSITNTISGISEQTNLLALNAAIEAARAGDTGRGFAVVADEVRGLAQRTGEATSEIETMLNEVREETNNTMAIMDSSIPQIEQGLNLSEESTQLLRAIEAKARESVNNVSEVEKGSTKQAELIETLEQNIADVKSSSEDISTKTQDFYEKNKTTYAELSQMANDLSRHADYFKL